MLRLVRGILLKGNGLIDVAPHLWPMVLFTLIVGAIAIRSYRETLD
jgi:ABC-2 type transport system permease protein